jgi:hypothetical protein
MSIASRQVKKETNRIIEEKMREGYIPTVEYITSQLGKYYSVNQPGSPTFKDRHLGYRKVFDVASYNSNLSEIYDDLNNLYEELVDQFTVVLSDFDYYNTERHRILHQINSLNDTLSDLVLVSGDTEGYVYSVHDDFIDRTKVDLTYSTCEINTEAGMCTLRESMSGITKVPMTHYFDTVNFPILAETRFANNILSNTVFPMSKFGYAFSDISTSWMQNIVTNTSGELQVSFIVNVSPDDELGQEITRIEVTGQSPRPMKVQPLYSNDNINFVALPIGYGEREKEVVDNRVVVWNFQGIHVNYIKFLITKSMEDEAISVNGLPAYRYVIGFKHIEFFKMGYNQSSTLYSKAFTVTDPAGEEMTIDKAALVVEQDVQPGTTIDYFLSLGDDTGDPTGFNWASVSPVNELNPTEQQVVDFRHVAFFNNVPDVPWNSSLYGTKLESYNGVDFYKVYQFPYEPVKDSVSLYRGKDNWQVTPRYDIKRKMAGPETLDFGGRDTVTLTYPTLVVDGGGLIRGTVRIGNEPSETPMTQYRTPGDFVVNYADHTITRSLGFTAISNQASSPARLAYAYYEYDEETAIPTEYSTYIYVLNQDGIDVNHTPFTQVQLNDGNYTTLTTDGQSIDVSVATRIKLAAGWHRIATTAEPESASDRFYAANGGKYLYQLVYKQFAYSDKLQETSWFVLKYNTLKIDHNKFCIVDYDGDGNKEIVVNYRPQTAKWSSASDDLLCAGGVESYVLSYKFITTATNNIYFKAVFNRDSTSSPTATSTLGSYTIKLGY